MVGLTFAAFLMLVVVPMLYAAAFRVPACATRIQEHS